MTHAAMYIDCMKENNRVILHTFIVVILHFTESTARYYPAFGQGNQSMMLADLFCTGLEDTLLDCRRNDYGIQHCAAYRVAGVQCEGTEFCA